MNDQQEELSSEELKQG